MKKFKEVIVIGGAGYVGAVLVPKLLAAGYRVRVYDLFIYGMHVFAAVQDDPRLSLIKGDVRDLTALEKALEGTEAVIHLACISNDPSVELDPHLAKSINLDCFHPCLQLAKKRKVKRFIYASSSSVYGIKETENVTEDMELDPLTDYSRFKAACEKLVLREAAENFICLILRPATVCGYSPRQRFDLTVNILTNHAVNNGKIIVFGGEQKRPNIHIDDIADLYVHSLEYEDEQIQKKIYNAGYENHTVMKLAETVRDTIGGKIEIQVQATDDLRSYHISSAKIKAELGFEPQHTIHDAVADLKTAFAAQRFTASMTNSLYYNIKRMKELGLK